MLVQNSLNVFVRQDLCLLDAICESLFLEIYVQNKRNIIIAVVYRDPHTNVEEFNCEIDACLQKLGKENKDVYIMGDFNINLLNCSTVNHVNEFVNILYNKSYRPLIDKPTRICKSSTTLIDNIFTNVCSKDISSGIFYNDITDHLPIFSITQNNLKENKSTNANKSRRCLNSTSIDSIRKELVNLDWSDIVQFDNVELAYDRFLNKFNDVVSNKCSKGKHKKNSSPRKSWITFSLLRCINKKKQAL